MAGPGKRQPSRGAIPRTLVAALTRSLILRPHWACPQVANPTMKDGDMPGLFSSARSLQGMRLRQKTHVLISLR